LLVFFYLISPLLAILSRKYAGIVFALILVYQLFLMNIIYPGVLGFTFPEGAYALTPPVLRNTMADWAIYFPLGLIFGLNARKMLPVLKRFAWPLFILSAVLFVIGLLDAFHVIHFEIARHICPIPFVLVLPAIKREKIPFVQTLEKIGKRSYGLYFTHLVVLVLSVFALEKLALPILGMPLILFPFLFLASLLLPLWAMGNEHPLQRQNPPGLSLRVWLIHECVVLIPVVPRSTG
jgi:peptidoglycan/LPS O-acetylase OafA/YrhL